MKLLSQVIRFFKAHLAQDECIPPYPLTADEWDEVRNPACKPTRRRWYLWHSPSLKFSVMHYRAMKLA
jgi:hypothetical protein